MTDTEAFIAAIVGRREDDLPRLVYADYLDEQGDADRAEFIRVQCDLARFGPNDSNVAAHASLTRRERSLLAAHEREWLNGTPLESYVTDEPHGTAYWVRPFDLGWTRGFVSTLRGTWEQWWSRGDALVRAFPIELVAFSNRPSATAGFRVKRRTTGDAARWEHDRWPSVEFELPSHDRLPGSVVDLVGTVVRDFGIATELSRFMPRAAAEAARLTVAENPALRAIGVYLDAQVPCVPGTPGAVQVPFGHALHFASMVYIDGPTLLHNTTPRHTVDLIYGAIDQLVGQLRLAVERPAPEEVEADVRRSSSAGERVQWLAEQPPGSAVVADHLCPADANGLPPRTGLPPAGNSTSPWSEVRRISLTREDYARPDPPAGTQPPAVRPTLPVYRGRCERCRTTFLAIRRTP